MNRRTFIKRSLLGVSSLAGLYTWQVEPFWLEFVKIKMPIKNLPEDLIGKTLMQISDLHIGNRFDHRFIIDSFNKAKAFKPDFVVYTGDYVTLHREKVQNDKLEEVFKNCVHGTTATLGILGNHDYGINWSEQEVADNISDILTKNGVVMLKNDQMETGGLTFIGLDDFWGPNFNPETVMNHYDRDKPSVLLCHNPDACDLDIWNGYQGWILSGHTHGGQCKPPFLPPPILPVKNKRYSAGIIELSAGRMLYINRALGHSWQVRFNVRPEITIFELVKG